MDTMHTWVDNLCLIQTGGEVTGITYHKGLEVGTPPLSKAISNFPVVVDPVGGVELTRITRWS